MYRKSELWEAYQKINIRDAISVIDQVKGAELPSDHRLHSLHQPPPEGGWVSPHRNVCVCVHVCAGRERADLCQAVSALHGQQNIVYHCHQLPVSHMTLACTRGGGAFCFFGVFC